MRVLFDHNVPRKLRRALAGYEVQTASEMGWALLENGELLRAAENNGFDIMVTGDKDLSYQQNLKGRELALIVLNSNNWNTVKLNLPAVKLAVDAALPGSFQIVSF